VQIASLRLLCHDCIRRNLCRAPGLETLLSEHSFSHKAFIFEVLKRPCGRGRIVYWLEAYSDGVSWSSLTPASGCTVVYNGVVE